VEICGFLGCDNAILLQYIAFSFELLGVPHDCVSSLQEFLKVCDNLSDFVGFEHCQYHVASDIIKGLTFLHEHQIAHRDLKPANVLVSNQHYASSDMVNFWWACKPVTAKLSDFGESRAALVQTNSLVHTHTQNVFRGTPVYMSPEQICTNDNSANVNDLQKMDIWALGMTV
jgi:serine/threonine protein kinase